MKRTELPEKMFSVSYLVRSVTWVVLFSMVFMAVYAQFSLSTWFNIHHPYNLMLTLLYYFGGVLMMLASKYLLWMVHRGHRITYLTYALWMLAEVFLLAVYYAFITEFTGVNFSFLYIFLKALACLLLIIFIPTSIYTLIVSLRVEKDKVRILAETAAERTGVANFVNLSDYNDNVKCTVDINSIYYIESQQNYVKIYYERDGLLDSHMLRCGTKNIERQLKGTPLVRCHRSFIVNYHKIKLLSKTRNGIFIELQLNGIHIPVSSKYYDIITETLSK